MTERTGRPPLIENIEPTEAQKKRIRKALGPLFTPDDLVLYHLDTSDEYGRRNRFFQEMDRLLQNLGLSDDDDMPQPHGWWFGWNEIWQDPHPEPEAYFVWPGELESESLPDPFDPLPQTLARFSMNPTCTLPNPLNEDQADGFKDAMEEALFQMTRLVNLARLRAGMPHLDEDFAE